MLDKLRFATSNKGKIREAEQILGIKVEPVEVEVDEVQPLDPIECVKKKAQAVFDKTDKPVLVEDTALFFKAWEGLPRVFVNYFMKKIGNEGIIRLMKGESNRRAKAQTSLCFYDGKEKTVVVGTRRVMEYKMIE